MNIIFDKEELLKSLTPAMNTVSTKNTMPATMGILFSADVNEGCTISSYDLEKGMMIKTNPEIIEGGSYIIPAARLYRIVRIMPGDKISIEVTEKNLARISSGKSEFKLSVTPGEEFPSLPELSCNKGFDISGEVLKKTVSQVQHAISTNENQRPVLLGAYFMLEEDGVRVVACDSNVLALRKRKCELENVNIEDDFKFIIPGKTLTELMKLVPDSDDKVRINFGRKHVIFVIDNIVFFSRLIEGEYINYDRIIPKESKISARINRGELLSGLERVALVSEDKSTGQTRSYVRCEFEDSLLKISAKAATYSVNDELICNKTGEDILIGLKCYYFMNVIKSIEEDEIDVLMNSPLMSVVIKNENCEDGEYLYMISPVKMVD
ncbi:MAG: DNA polymerase III subunit beta [Ruminococcaceae bacterium]|nr:DNA polymerase III subunit beta [Oscillospiraceae bacterium]